MKKAIIMLLAVLMLIAFVSCNDQKVTEEMREQATKDFIETFDECMNYFSEPEKECIYDLSNWNSTTADEAEIWRIKDIIKKYVGTNDEIISAKGTVEFKNVSMKMGTEMEYTVHEIVKGVEIVYTAEGKEKSLTLDCDISMKESGNMYTEEMDGEIIVKSLNVNGTKYRPIEYKLSSRNVEGKEEITITKAVCDGIELDCKEVKKLIYEQSI